MTNIKKSKSQPTGKNRQLSFDVSPEFWKEYKMYAVYHDMSMVELFMESFKALKKEKGALYLKKGNE